MSSHSAVPTTRNQLGLCGGGPRPRPAFSLNEAINRDAPPLAPEPGRWTILQRKSIHGIVWTPHRGDRAGGDERKALVLGGKEAVLVQVNLESSGPELLVKHRFALDDVVGDGAFFGRANIGNARIAGLERDLNLKGYDYNILLTAFYVAYIVFELPCQMLTKWWGPGKTLPIFGFLFGLFSFVMAFVHTFGAAVAVRFLLGITESAVFPGISFYLSRYYRKDELGFRLACFLVCTAAAGAVGGLLASGILKIDSIGWLTEWRMIFFVEGIISMGVGAICWFFMSDRPSACKWLTPEERELAEFRLVAEQPGQHEAIDALHSKAVWAGICNTNTIVIACVFLLNNITFQGVGFFLPTIVRSIYPQESTIHQQLRTVPPYVCGAFMTLFTGYLSWKTRRRGLYLLLSVPPLVAGFSLYVATLSPHLRYTAAFLVALGCFNFGALCTAWSAANVTTDTARAASIGTTVFAGNCGGLIATWTFLPKDGPRYLPGNAFNLANSVAMFFLVGGLLLWQKRENKAKAAGRDDHRIEGKTESEVAALGQKHPDFRYAP